jgi:hypothetical protein
MNKRKHAEAMMHWSEETRRWATAAGRALALDLYFNRDTNLRPYEVGAVLDPGEKVWAETPVQFNLDWPLPRKEGQAKEPAFRPWLVTSDRVVGRLADERLHGYRWEHTVGARVDLTPDHEVVSLDIEGEPMLMWSGPAVAPMAVAAIFHLYGPIGVIEHPGLVALRVSSECLQVFNQ